MTSSTDDDSANTVSKHCYKRDKFFLHPTPQETEEYEFISLQAKAIKANGGGREIKANTAAATATV
jgi:hypothetical protein